MKVITYNLHKGKSAGLIMGQHSILEEAAHAVAGRRPDVLFCQEVYHSIADDVKQCHFITEVTGYDHAFGANRSYAGGCHGNATIARMAMTQHVNIDVSESFLEKRGILHTTLATEDCRIETLNTHLSLTARQRKRQWFRLIEALPVDSAVPVLVAGDFNDWTGSLDRMAYRTGFLRNALWQLPRRQRRSFPAKAPRWALDRVYFRGLRLRSVRVLDGDPWRRLSDHLPVEVEFATA